MTPQDLVAKLKRSVAAVQEAPAEARRAAQKAVMESPVPNIVTTVQNGPKGVSVRFSAAFGRKVSPKAVEAHARKISRKLAKEAPEVARDVLRRSFD